MVELHWARYMNSNFLSERLVYTLFFKVDSSEETNVTYFNYPLKIVQINSSTQLLSFDERNKCDVTLSIKVCGDPYLMDDMFLMILI